jgi:hypothetical protein
VATEGVVKDLIETIHRLSESDISVGLQTVNGSTLLLWLGDEIEGIEAQCDFRFDQLDAAVDWVRDTACMHYPASLYAQHLTEWVQPVLASGAGHMPEDRRP